jgi:hypothetical protein
MRVAVHVVPCHRLDHRLFGVGTTIVSIGRRRPFRLLAGRTNAGGKQQE